MPPEETKRFNMGDDEPSDIGATKKFQDASDESQEAGSTKKLHDIVEEDTGETRALEPIDPGATKHFAPSNSGTSNGALIPSLAPKRLRVIMPDQSELVFDNLSPHLIVGRKSTVNTRHIDIDMSKIDTGIFGVSRIHAMIIPDDRHGLVIKDLQSVNGTYINSKKLRPNEAYPLAPGDFVKFGNLKVKLLFELGK